MLLPGLGVHTPVILEAQWFNPLGVRSYHESRATFEHQNANATCMRQRDDSMYVTMLLAIEFN